MTLTAEQHERIERRWLTPWPLAWDVDTVHDHGREDVGLLLDEIERLADRLSDCWLALDKCSIAFAVLADPQCDAVRPLAKEARDTILALFRKQQVPGHKGNL